MELNFIKMQGCGNDYIFIDNLSDKYKNVDFGKIACKISDRNFGIGGDGLVIIENSKIADAKMSMYNSDGSVGKMCGNAVRCIAKYLIDHEFVVSSKAKIETLSGIKECHANIEKGVCESVTVDMGLPDFDAKNIIKSDLYFDECIKRPFVIRKKKFELSMVSMGNPHTVLFVDSLEKINIESLGQSIEKHSMYLDRTNVEFVQILGNKNLKVRVFERGAGETLACGTGACATVAVAIKLGLCNIDENITVSLLGGDLIVRQSKNTMYLKGSCDYVFCGTVNLYDL